MKKCDILTRYVRNDLRMETTLHVPLPLVPFEKWGIDYVEKSTPAPQRAWLILLWPLNIEPKGRKPNRSRPIQQLMLLTSYMRILFLDLDVQKF